MKKREPPWHFGLSAEEQARELLLADLIATCLEKGRQIARERQHSLSEHSPWNPQTDSCERCGMTAREFHAVSYGYGLPCGTGAPTP